MRRRGEARAGHAQLVLAHFVEDAIAVAENDGNAGGGIPDDVAETAEAGEVDADLVPVGVESDVCGRADGDEALRGLRDGAGVGDIELESCAGSEGSGERNRGFVKLAGVVHVGVESGDGEGDIAAVEADAFPVERGRDLQRDVGERGFAVVAHGEEGADGDPVVDGVEMNVHVESGEGDGVALGIRGDGSGDRLAGRLRCGGAGGGRGLAVVIDGAGEDDFAVRFGG